MLAFKWLKMNGAYRLWLQPLRLTGLTCMCEYVPLEVVAAPESAVAVVTDEILLDFQGKVIIHVHRWKYVL